MKKTLIVVAMALVLALTACGEKQEETGDTLTMEELFLDALGSEEKRRVVYTANEICSSIR